jgi:hypothetical protein
MIFYITILCILFYIYCYFIYPTNVSILQSNLQEFDFNLLLKRQPLVIEDSVKDVLSLLKSWFEPNIIQDTQFDDKRIWNVNSHKYLYIYALIDTEVLLYAPGHKVVNDMPDNNEPVIAIKLKATQSIIVPYRWYYNTKNNVKLYGIHDYVTYVMDYII